MNIHEAIDIISSLMEAANASIEKVGRRFYFVNAPFETKDVLKGGGCKWDPDVKRWWIGNADKAEKLLAKINSGSSRASSGFAAKRPEDEMAVGTATYKGRPYYLLFHGQTKMGMGAKLAFKDGTKSFWASSMGDVRSIDYYEKPRRVGDLVAYAARMRKERGDGGGGGYGCAECGARHAPYSGQDSSGITGDLCGRCVKLHWTERSYG